jgi:uncharacterized protein with ParB-like and HNH nuclease domain
VIGLAAADHPAGAGLLEKLKDAVLVKIEVPSHSDAFMLFESINNRGIPLSAIDIIKNNLLAELDKRQTMASTARLTSGKT